MKRLAGFVLYALLSGTLAGVLLVDAAQGSTRSAWTTDYHYGLAAPAGSQLGYAIVGVKRELAYNGDAGGMVLDSPVFGDAARNSTKRFQAAQGIYVSGVVGPTTARYLFRKRALAAEATYGIPEHLLAKMKTLESANDPNAVGPSGLDLGLYQIHLPSHPEVTAAQAIDPAFATVWTGEDFSNAHGQLRDWDAALAAHNIGIFYAAKWLAAGKPSSGLLLADGTTDIFTVATTYVALVRSRAY